MGQGLGMGADAQADSYGRALRNDRGVLTIIAGRCMAEGCAQAHGCVRACAGGDDEASKSRVFHSENLFRTLPGWEEAVAKDVKWSSPFEPPRHSYSDTAKREPELFEKSAQHLPTAVSPRAASALVELRPTPDSLCFEDPRFGSEEGTHIVNLIGFSGSSGAPTAVDEVHQSAFLGNAFDLGPEGIKLEAPPADELQVPRTFRNAEAAFQALKFWPIAEDFAELSAQEAIEVGRHLADRADLGFCGYGGPWQAMKVVLRAKFSPGSKLAFALLRTDDAFLLSHHEASLAADKVAPGVETLEWTDGGDGEGRNWLGFQLMLLRDQLASTPVDQSGEWAPFLGALLDVDTGFPRRPSTAATWQEVVRSATRSVKQATIAKQPHRLLKEVSDRSVHPPGINEPVVIHGAGEQNRAAQEAAEKRWQQLEQQRELHERLLEFQAQQQQELERAKVVPETPSNKQIKEQQQKPGTSKQGDQQTGKPQNSQQPPPEQQQTQKQLKQQKEPQQQASQQQPQPQAASKAAAGSARKKAPQLAAAEPLPPMATQPHTAVGSTTSPASSATPLSATTPASASTATVASPAAANPTPAPVAGAAHAAPQPAPTPPVASMSPTSPAAKSKAGLAVRAGTSSAASSTPASTTSKAAPATPPATTPTPSVGPSLISKAAPATPPATTPTPSVAPSRISKAAPATPPATTPTPSVAPSEAPSKAGPAMRPGSSPMSPTVPSAKAAPAPAAAPGARTPPTPKSTSPPAASAMRPGSGMQPPTPTPSKAAAPGGAPAAGGTPLSPSMSSMRPGGGIRPTAAGAAAVSGGGTRPTASGGAGASAPGGGMRPTAPGGAAAAGGTPDAKRTRSTTAAAAAGAGGATPKAAAAPSTQLGSPLAELPAGHYVVEVTRPPKSVLGVEFELDGVMRVVKVTGGIIGDWNASHPEAAVQPDDLCVEVNGVRGDAKALVAVIKKNANLRMILARQPPLPEGHFVVKLERPPKSALGVDIRVEDEGLVVLELRGGLLGEWSARHPEATVQPGDICVEVNGVRGVGEDLHAEIKKPSSFLRLVFVRPQGAAVPVAPRVTSGDILADLNAAERLVYGYEFEQLAAGKTKVMLDNKAFHDMVMRVTMIEPGHLDMVLIKHAPDLRMSMDGLLGLVHEYVAPDAVGIAAFMELAPDGKAAAADACRTALQSVVEQALGSDASETRAWWEGAARAALPGDPGVVDLQAWLKAYRHCVRMTRLRRQLGE